MGYKTSLDIRKYALSQILTGITKNKTSDFVFIDLFFINLVYIFALEGHSSGRTTNKKKAQGLIINKPHTHNHTTMINMLLLKHVTFIKFN